MKLELSMLAGAESKQFSMELTKQIDRLENLAKLLDPKIEIRNFKALKDEAYTKLKLKKN